MKNDKEKFKNEFKQRLYKWTLTLLHFLNSVPETRSAGVIVKQLTRSGTSIIANYVEAQAASSKKDFTNFFHHALKSANESKLWLALIRDSEGIKTKEVGDLL